MGSRKGCCLWGLRSVKEACYSTQREKLRNSSNVNCRPACCSSRDSRDTSVVRRWVSVEMPLLVQSNLHTATLDYGRMPKSSTFSAAILGSGNVSEPWRPSAIMSTMVNEGTLCCSTILPASSAVRRPNGSLEVSNVRISNAMPAMSGCRNPG